MQTLQFSDSLAEGSVPESSFAFNLWASPTVYPLAVNRSMKLGA
jgi:hypothetical protein